MKYQIKKDKNQLSYEDFYKIDSNCFPHQPYNKEQFDNAIKNLVWTVQVEQLIIGYMIAIESSKELHLSRIAVIDTYRNEGLASALLEELLNYGKSKNKHVITLSVQTDNEAALQFYKKYHFKTYRNQAQFIFNINELEDYCKNEPNIHAATKNKTGTKYTINFLYNNKIIGKCNLDTSFPGSNYLYVENVEDFFESAIYSLTKYLKKHQKQIILTTNDQEIIHLCNHKGYHLNYELIEMKKELFN